MLARTFKTAADLDITDKQYDALIMTLEKMESGEMKKTNSFQGIKQTKKTEFSGLFNMAVWLGKSEHNCGTVGCIGGTSSLLAKDKNLWDGSKSIPQVDELFFPSINNTNLMHITIAQATQALRNFLTIGTPNWEDVIDTSENY